MKVRLIDYFTEEDRMLERVLIRAIKCAKTHEELEEAKKCMGHLMRDVLIRSRAELKKKSK